MSVLFYPGSIRILGSDANGNNVMLCEMAVDDIANLPAANAFINDGYVLSMGCVATAINDNSKHRLNGSGNWVQIAAGTSTYTRAEIDALLSTIDAEIDNIYGVGVIIPDNSDLNDYITPGSYYVGNSASAATIANIPLGGSGFRLIVRNTSASNRYRQEFIKPNNPESLYVRHFTTAGVWSSWYKFTAEIVT